MASFPFSIQYPPAGDGYWTPVTSTLNWCEEDYYATIYSAEIVNTLTNLAFVYLAYKDETQLLDELAMIYTTCIMFYATFSHGRSSQTAMLVALLAVFIAVFVTVYYHYIKDPLFHQNAFALLTAIVFFRSMYAMEATLRPSRRDITETTTKETSSPAVRKSLREERDLAILRIMWQMIPVGLGSIALGFLIWNLDNAYCPTLRSWRRSVGLPWSIFLEGHGWWHIFTGLAQYFNLTWSIWLRYCFDGRQDEVEMIWPSVLTSVPHVERKDKTSRAKGA